MASEELRGQTDCFSGIFQYGQISKFKKGVIPRKKKWNKIFCGHAYLHIMSFITTKFHEILLNGFRGVALTRKTGLTDWLTDWQTDWRVKNIIPSATSCVGYKNIILPTLWFPPNISRVTTKRLYLYKDDLCQVWLKNSRGSINIFMSFQHIFTTCIISI